ncbi:MAG: trypsin-like peptidase domain-containing protein [Anaerolineales bacterium]
MQKKTLVILMVMVVIGLLASACSSPAAALLAGTTNDIRVESSNESQEVQDPDESAQVVQPQTLPLEPGLLAAYESTLTEIYEQVGPSVVNIRVVGQGFAFLPDPGQAPPLPEMPELPDSHLPSNQSLGSGFVWDQQGYIITNNHVVANAELIEVTFSDETVVEAEIIGSDPDSDLAVIKVDVPAEHLVPVQLADSEQVRVGQLAIAIGNPFGLEGTMTVGIVSALGRSLPASDGLTGGPVYNIPNVIQTDAPINPGNSGGVLLNAAGELIGVTTAIESPVRANAGVGFVIPASIVERVVPELIENGSFSHPFLGITGISLFPDLAESMDLDMDQRGAMVAEIVPDGPADKAGLQGSDREVMIEGQNMQVGGDVITAINGDLVQDMDDLIAYLSAKSVVDQEVNLKIIRDGKEMEIKVTLAARPRDNVQAALPSLPVNGRAWLGIVGIPLTPEIAGEMDLTENQGGVLILQVQPDSPAQSAGLLGSDEPVTINGETVIIGGDVITRVDGNDVTNVQELAAYLQEVGAGEQVALTVLRNGELLNIEVELGQQS